MYNILVLYCAYSIRGLTPLSLTQLIPTQQYSSPIYRSTNMCIAHNNLQQLNSNSKQHSKTQYNIGLTRNCTHTCSHVWQALLKLCSILFTNHGMWSIVILTCCWYPLIWLRQSAAKNCTYVDVCGGHACVYMNGVGVGGWWPCKGLVRWKGEWRRLQWVVWDLVVPVISLSLVKPNYNAFTLSFASGTRPAI